MRLSVFTRVHIITVFHPSPCRQAQKPYKTEPTLQRVFHTGAPPQYVCSFPVPEATTFRYGVTGWMRAPEGRGTAFRQGSVRRRQRSLANVADFAQEPLPNWRRSLAAHGGNPAHGEVVRSHATLLIRLKQFPFQRNKKTLACSRAYGFTRSVGEPKPSLPNNQKG